MKILSIKVLAETVRKLREEKGYTEEVLGILTGINKMLIGRIEREDFLPSIVQFEALSSALGFDLTEMFVEKERANFYIAIRHETLSESEKKGIEKLITMMLSLRQQIHIRSLFENESNCGL